MSVLKYSDGLNKTCVFVSYVWLFLLFVSEVKTSNVCWIDKYTSHQCEGRTKKNLINLDLYNIKYEKLYILKYKLFLTEK